MKMKSSWSDDKPQEYMSKQIVSELKKGVRTEHYPRLITDKSCLLIGSLNGRPRKFWRQRLSEFNNTLAMSKIFLKS